MKQVNEIVVIFVGKIVRHNTVIVAAITGKAKMMLQYIWYEFEKINTRNCIKYIVFVIEV